MGFVVAVLDASALLAFLLDEDGADVVSEAFEGETCCSAANWSEVAQRTLAVGYELYLVRSLLLGYGLRIEPVTADDAEWAARRWRRSEGLSLADRLCMALGERLDTEILTADGAWGSSGRMRQIR